MIAVWDPSKAAANHRKHGIRFVEALAVLFDPLALCLTVDEVDGEERQVVVGRDGLDRVVVVVHVHHGPIVRIISARRATRTERRQYEEGIRFQ